MHKYWQLMAAAPLAVMAQQQDQAPAYRLVASVVRPVDYFTTDRMGNVYVVGPDGLFKFDTSGAQVGAFSDKSFGRISSVDATDPLKIILFGRDFRKVSILDDRLSMQAAFNLTNLGIGQPQLVCRSRHDGYWVYDAQTRQMTRFDTGLKQVTEGEILSNKLQRFDPDYMVESSDWIYLNDPANGIVMADRYGTYFKVLQGVNASYFQCEGESLLFARDGSLVRLNAATLSTEEEPLPEVPGIRQARLERNRLYLSGDGFLHIYAF